MTNRDLPMLCVGCQKLLPTALGKTVPKQHRCHDRVWLCYRCQRKTETRGRGTGKRSPLEVEAKDAIAATGYRAVEEYALGPFIYDFAVPPLRILIEVDSARWHRHPSRLCRDREKTKLAHKEGWTLLRVTTKRPEKLSLQTRTLILRREAELSAEKDY